MRLPIHAKGMMTKRTERAPMSALPPKADIQPGTYRNGALTARATR